MRVIDAEPIIERLKNAIYLGKRIGEDTANLEAVLADVEAQHTAEPEIIRCKDCKWFGEIGCAIGVVDDTDKPTENDYCSFAERRSDG